MFVVLDKYGPGHWCLMVLCCFGFLLSVLDLLEKIQLDSKMHFQSTQLSGGQKRKLSVCIALIGRTSVVILDEPSSGMLYITDNNISIEVSFIFWTYC